MRDEDNKYCCDCDSKGPRWASWNLGIFLCIRCAGIHRNLGKYIEILTHLLLICSVTKPVVRLSSDCVVHFHCKHSNCFLFSVGVHISRVKSVNLDTWAPEQVVSLQQMGNSRARAVYEALVADNFRRPQTDSGLESFIRAKYEQKKWIAREWVPPPPITKVDWDKEIEEELENQKRKKKSTATIPETVKSAPSPVNVALPAPLPKPHSPKNPRVESKKVVAASNNLTDLLGLDSAPPNASFQPPSIPKAATTIGDGFDFFANLSPSPIVAPVPQPNNATPKHENSLKQEEDDFFNQKFETGGAEKGKMTKDSILALYGSAPPSFAQPQAQPFNANFQQFPGGFVQTTAPVFNSAPQQPPQFIPTGQPMMFNNGNFGTTTNIQQINKMNEENIKKIENIQIFKVQS